MNKNVIGLVGYARSGKDTVAKFMFEYGGYCRIASADPIKGMIYTLMLHLGFYTAEKRYPGWKREFVERHKETELMPGFTIRHALQTLGTEWGRDLGHPDIWVQCSIAKTKQYLHPIPGTGKEPSKVVWTDVRFFNEADAIRELGGQLWYVDRGGPGEVGTTHESEAHIENLREHCLQVIDNTGTLEQLESIVKELIS